MRLNALYLIGTLTISAIPLSAGAVAAQPAGAVSAANRLGLRRRLYSPLCLLAGWSRLSACSHRRPATFPIGIIDSL
jgi:hypothetical protein